MVVCTHGVRVIRVRFSASRLDILKGLLLKVPVSRVFTMLDNVAILGIPTGYFKGPFIEGAGEQSFYHVG